MAHRISLLGTINIFTEQFLCQLKASIRYLFSLNCLPNKTVISMHFLAAVFLAWHLFTLIENWLCAVNGIPWWNIY